MNQEKKNLIESRLQAAFNPSYVEVQDESEQHRGHGGYHAAGSHFAVTISAECFNHLTRVEAHRNIYAVLADMMPVPIHALRIKIVLLTDQQ